MNTMTKLAKRFLSPQVRTLINAGYMDGGLHITRAGRYALYTILVDAHIAELTEMAKQELEEQKNNNN